MNVPPPPPPPLPLLSGLLLSRDFLVVSRITGTATSLGVTVKTAADVSQMRSLLEAGALNAGEYGFCLIDLAMPQTRIADVLAVIAEGRPLRTIAFGAHVHTARLQEARDAGCDEVLPRSRFFAILPEILTSKF